MKRTWHLLCVVAAAICIVTAVASLLLTQFGGTRLAEKGEFVLLGGTSLVLAMIFSYATVAVLRMTEEESRSLLQKLDDPTKFNWLMRSEPPVRFWIWASSLGTIAALGIASSTLAILKICLE